MNQYAQALGRLAKGKPKRFTVEQINAAKVRLASARAKRLEQLKQLKQKDSVCKSQ
jgi:hypothetical protein